MGVFAAAIALSACLHAAGHPPAIAIIVDDLGNRPRHDFALLENPAPLTLAILPFSPHTRRLAEAAHQAGRDVLLHLPMEAESHNHLLGPGAITSSMSEAEFSAAVQRAVADVPHLVGVNNHMGSKLTRDRQRMRWLMRVLKGDGSLFFVDSRTTAHSVAAGAAAEAAVSYLERDVFLDNRREARYIQARFDELVEQALVRGDAVGIAHPHAETLAVLRQRLARLQRVRLVPLTRLLELRECRTAKAALARTSIAPAQGDDSGD